MFALYIDANIRKIVAYRPVFVFSLYIIGVDIAVLFVSLPLQCNRSIYERFHTYFKAFRSPLQKVYGSEHRVNVLSAILNLFSFALIIPILQILFKMDEGNYTFMDWNFNAGSWESWKALPELIKNNFFWYVSDLIEVHGGSFALIMLGIFLIVATFLKVATMYLAFYT